MLFDAAGKILAVSDHFTKDSGAYTPVGIGTMSNTATHMLGPYHVPSFEAAATLVNTHKTPNAPYRGTGRPEGSFVMERLIDLAADALGLDPVELRRRNLIPAAAMPYAVGVPYRDGVPVIYDSGDYPAAFEQALDMLGGLDAFRARQQAAWREGRYLGLGIVPYVEGTGAGPFEGATVRIDPNGSIYVATGACAQGQGHATVFAQVAADEWGVTPDRITMALADTAAIANGWGTIASRSGVNSSGAIRKASQELRQKVFAIAAHILECGESDLELRDGGVGVVGVPQMQLSLKQIAAAARPGWDNQRPQGVSGGLEVTSYFEPETVTWSYATHAGIVEVLPTTGAIKILQYVVVHDAGTLDQPAHRRGPDPRRGLPRHRRRAARGTESTTPTASCSPGHSPTTCCRPPPTCPRSRSSTTRRPRRSTSSASRASARAASRRRRSSSPTASATRCARSASPSRRRPCAPPTSSKHLPRRRKQHEADPPRSDRP